MAHKFEIINQSIVITDTLTSEIKLDIPKSHIYYNHRDITQGNIVLYDLNTSNGFLTKILQISLSTAVDEFDVAFTATTFIGFCRQNLGFKTGGDDGEGSGFSGSYEDLTGQPSINVTGTKVLDTGLTSANQDTNDVTRVYQWNNDNLDANYISIANSGRNIVFSKACQFMINAHIQVVNATANERSMFVTEVLHYNSSDVLLARYKGSAAYIRDDISPYDDGASSVFTTIVPNIGDYINARTVRLFSEDGRDDNPAGQTQSRLIINAIEYTLS
jgi:hypothetical protein